MVKSKNRDACATLTLAPFLCTRDRTQKMHRLSQVSRAQVIRYLDRSGRVRLQTQTHISCFTPPRRFCRTMSAATHPVESSQQPVQIPALDAQHAPIAQTEGASKPKKEKKAATASAYPLEVRFVTGVWTDAGTQLALPKFRCRHLRSSSHIG
jgi:hypothetical protein